MNKLDKLQSYSLAKKTLIDLYKTESGKKFVHHLIYAFNVEKPKYILYSKVTLFDCLTKADLNTISSFGPIPEQIKDLNRILKITPEDQVESISSELTQVIEEYVLNNHLDRVALHSDKTNKILGIEEFQALQDFITEQIKTGNKVIKTTMKVLRSGNSVRSKREEKAEDVSGDFTSKLEALKNKYNKSK